MKAYTITVNGVAYDVTVEERAAGAAPVASAPVVMAAPVAPAPAPVAPAPAPAPAAAPAPAPAAAPAPAPAPAPVATGGIEVKASVPGKVVKIDAAVGQAVKPGDSIVVLEAMKMEIPIVAPEAGTVASINVSVGQAVESGDLLASLN